MERTQLSDDVASRLRAEIMSGSLKPGSFIRLDDTAAQLGVSITPVREALLTLRGDGLVRLEPNRGYVVLPMTRQGIADIFWLQSTMARELAASATARITDTEIDELGRINETLATTVESADSDAVVAAEFAFHRAFNRVAGRIKLAWFLLHVARWMPPLLYAADPRWGADAVDNHHRLIAALRARDVEGAVEHTTWQFTDGALRLTGALESSGIWD
ncbi:MAG: GntR family transcriptional regulator [Mycobacterium sp.]